MKYVCLICTEYNSLQTLLLPGGDEGMRNLLKQLSNLQEQEQRISALLTLTEAQDDADLIALRAIFNQLVEDTCNLVCRPLTLYSVCFRACMHVIDLVIFYSSQMFTMTY